MLNIKTKETFQHEVKKLMSEFDMTILEAMTSYTERYGLDVEYVVDNLLSPGLKEQLQIECEKKNMIKKSHIKLEGI